MVTDQLALLAQVFLSTNHYFYYACPPSLLSLAGHRQRRKRVFATGNEEDVHINQPFALH